MRGILLILLMTSLAWGGDMLDLPVDAPPLPPTKQAPLPPVFTPEEIHPPTVFGQEVKSENNTLFYVLDISGSMGMDSYQGPKDLNGNPTTIQRITKAKTELCRSIESLPSNFRFNVETYDCGTNLWQMRLQPADQKNKASAQGWVNQQQPSGGTGTGPAVALALFDRQVKYLVLLTDGQPNCGAGPVDGYYTGSYFLVLQAHRDMIKQSNTQKARIDVLGICADGSMREFCIWIASDNQGSYRDVE